MQRLFIVQCIEAETNSKPSSSEFCSTIQFSPSLAGFPKGHFFGIVRRGISTSQMSATNSINALKGKEITEHLNETPKPTNL